MYNLIILIIQNQINFYQTRIHFITIYLFINTEKIPVTISICTTLSKRGQMQDSSTLLVNTTV